jgi:hypothetical protein
MARDQFGAEINPYDLSHVASVMAGKRYPTPAEPHTTADLLRPLAADNARLQRRIVELEAACEAARELLTTTLTVRNSWFLQPVLKQLEAAIAKARLEVTNGENSADK